MINVCFIELATYPYRGWEMLNQAHFHFLRAAHAGSYERAQQLLTGLRQDASIDAAIRELEQGKAKHPIVLDL